MNALLAETMTKDSNQMLNDNRSSNHHRRRHFIVPNKIINKLVYTVILTHDENIATFAIYTRHYAHIIVTDAKHAWQHSIIIVYSWGRASVNGTTFDFGSLFHGMYYVFIWRWGL